MSYRYDANKVWIHGLNNRVAPWIAPPGLPQIRTCRHYRIRFLKTSFCYTTVHYFFALGALWTILGGGSG